MGTRTVDLMVDLLQSTMERRPPLDAGGRRQSGVWLLRTNCQALLVKRPGAF